jgi:putative chitinase
MDKPPKAPRLRQTAAAIAVTGVAGLALASPSQAMVPPPDGGGGEWANYPLLVDMYGTRVGDADTVKAGMSGLSDQMTVGNITTSRRRAAFFATLLNESRFEYSAVQAGATSTYKGRGFIQLTGYTNYKTAGDHFGVDFVNYPGRINDLAWSAKVARWYWGVNNINAAADDLDMGRVSRLIGYAASDAEDQQRCADFKRAMKVLTGSVPAGVTCLRH